MRLRELLAEAEDRFTGSTFYDDDDGREYSVERLAAIARAGGDRYLRRDVPISTLEHDLEWWDQGAREGGQSEAHMRSVDTSFPLLVLQNPDGHLSVCDGLNRLKKARDVEHRQTVDIYLIPWTAAMQDACAL